MVQLRDDRVRIAPTRGPAPDPATLLVQLRRQLFTAQQWRLRAACRQADPELFFPGKGDAAAVRAAKMVCATCPVVDACLDDAIAVGEQYGIRGGLSARERQVVARERRRSA